MGTYFEFSDYTQTYFEFSGYTQSLKVFRECSPENIVQFLKQTNSFDKL